MALGMVYLRPVNKHDNQYHHQHRTISRKINQHGNSVLLCRQQRHGTVARVAQAVYDLRNISNGLALKRTSPDAPGCTSFSTVSMVPVYGAFALNVCIGSSDVSLTTGRDGVGERETERGRAKQREVEIQRKRHRARGTERERERGDGVEPSLSIRLLGQPSPLSKTPNIPPKEDPPNTPTGVDPQPTSNDNNNNITRERERSPVGLPLERASVSAGDELLRRRSGPHKRVRFSLWLGTPSRSSSSSSRSARRCWCRCWRRGSGRGKLAGRLHPGHNFSELGNLRTRGGRSSVRGTGEIRRVHL